MKRSLTFLLIVFIVFSTSMVIAQADLERESSVQKATVMLKIELSGIIDSALAEYVKKAVEEASSNNYAILMLLNTPGGSLDAALHIIEILRRSSVPVVGYVVGRWAVSAGTLILFCTHVAAMQPGTVVGAMQPVEVSPFGGYRPVNETKILNPIYKEAEACLKLRNRNTTVAELMVYHNFVMDAEEAYNSHVVEFVAANVDELVQKLRGLKVDTVAGTWMLEPETIIDYPPSLSIRLAHALSDPLISSLISSLASLLILVGILTANYHVLAFGVVLFLVSLLGVGFHINIIALALIIVGISLVIAEILFVPGTTVVGVAGFISLVLGLLLLPAVAPTTISPEYMRLTFYTVAAITLPIAGLLGIIFVKAVGVWRKKPIYQPSIVGKIGYAIDDIPEGREGFVVIEGEYWRARAKKPVRRNQRVKVVGKEGPLLVVEPLEEE
ncbi:MAG TPA: nodulation protein NfeD [Pyrodictium sp.]|nr:nodulation protein NfeD [Pyrodictium sp.]